MGAESDKFSQFSGEIQKQIAAFAAKSPRLEDLASTHPLLFIALATGYGDANCRAAAIKASRDGRRLRTVCDLAEIPYCLRSVPIELCPVPLLPARWSIAASPALVRLMPREPMMLCKWVRGIFFANAAAGEEFALWLSKRHELFAEGPFDQQHLLPLALLYWFARNPEHELHSLIPAPWSMRAGSRRLLNATRAWLYRICCRVYLPASSECQQPYMIGPYQAIELADCRSLLSEQQMMDNCLDRYGRRIAWGTHAVFSLRTQTGERIANFEVAIHAPAGPLVTEIRGHSNADVPADVKQAVLQWVEVSSSLLRRPVVEHLASQTDPDDAFADLIAPYVLTHKKLLATVDPVTLHGLERDLAALAARLKIKSWPVRFERTSRVGASLHPGDDR